MISKMYNFWLILISSLWFVPALFCAAYFLITLAIYNLETQYFSDFYLPDLFFSGSNEDAKTVVLALLSSMITMTTLAISVTMVVLSLAATQLGPRLIRTFMSDHKTQDFIGLFFGSVIACFLITVILHNAGQDANAPRLTVSFVFAICFANLFVLLAFVHHVAQSSIADQVILRVTNDLIKSLDRLTFSEENPDRGRDDKDKNWPKDFERKKQRLYFNRCGYVQHIDYNNIVTIAEQYGLYIKINFKAGHFLVEGEDGVRIYPTKEKYCDKIEQEIRDCFIIGNTRTPTQDIEYSIRHLVEIGLRAQSPGMDDNFTAITVLDRLSSALAILFKKDIPPVWLADNNGKVRLWAKQSDEADIIFSAFDQMRHSAREKPDIMFHILKKIEILCDLAETECQKAGLERQLKEVEFDLQYLDGIVLNIEEMKNLCSELLEKVA
ncbi:MAG: DUF2254 domain-containing protein [Alphaproteobacteria bacterium]|nr:DUF2254 domain-containing protein [Alphaproteobacteria bacterium]